MWKAQLDEALEDDGKVAISFRGTPASRNRHTPCSRFLEPLDSLARPPEMLSLRWQGGGCRLGKRVLCARKCRQWHAARKECQYWRSLHHQELLPLHLFRTSSVFGWTRRCLYFSAGHFPLAFGTTIAVCLTPCKPFEVLC